MVGYLPCNDENIVLLEINNNFSIPIFKDQNKLVEVMKQIKVSFNKVKKITNAREFLGGISTRLPNKNKVSVLIDPKFNVDSGKLFYTELTLES